MGNCTEGQVYVRNLGGVCVFPPHCASILERKNFASV